jgi:diguanylate cyclase (GGDEF)-like protein
MIARAAHEDVAGKLMQHHAERAKWEALIVSCLGLVVVTAGIWGLWVSSTDSIKENYRHYLIGLAEVAATLVDVPLHDTIRDPSQQNGPDYRRAVAPLRRLRDAVPDVRYVYTVVPDGNDVRFVLDAADPGHRTAAGLSEQAGVWELYTDTGPAMRRTLGDATHPGVASATDEPTRDAWGIFMSGLAPIRAADGRQIGAVGVDVEASVYVARLDAALHRALLGLAPAGLLIVAFGIAFYRIRLRGLADAHAAVDSAQAAARAARVLREASLSDQLTGLANRARFMECLSDAVERVNCGRQQGLAVLFLDFDQFKLVNDSLGHKSGDDLLQQAAQRLQAAVRLTDTVCAPAANLVSRFGGDEFLILINDLPDPQEAVRIGERILNELAPAYRLFDGEVHSTASIGIVTSSRGGASAEELVRNADLAMYEAKRAGRACVVVFNESMHTRLTRRLTIESQLRRAIGTSQLYLVYQPIVELLTGDVVSVEALLRWDHPTLGAISPAEFIPVAEESGLIIAVGQRVLQQACRALVAWRTSDLERAPRTVSVNISRAELALGNQLLQQVRAVLAETGLPASCLQLEVTEREVMRNPEVALQLLNDLRTLGVKLAMDDFGTGTSSLSLLRQYPFDTIKIDRSFVEGLIDNQDVLAVIHATVNLIEHLGMASLAEGVEQRAQVAVLQSLGCRYAQGYLFSRPVGAERLLEVLSGGIAVVH